MRKFRKYRHWIKESHLFDGSYTRKAYLKAKRSFFYAHIPQIIPKKEFWFKRFIDSLRHFWWWFWLKEI